MRAPWGGRWSAALVGVFMALGSGCATPVDPATAERDVRAAEAGRQAAVTSGAPIEEFYYDGFIATGPSGRRNDKPTAVRLRVKPDATRVDSVAVVGDAAVVVGTQAYTTTNPRTERFMRVWLNRGGRWQTAATHVTTVSPNGSPAVVAASVNPPADATVTPSTTGAEADVLAAQKARDAMFAAKDAAAYAQQTHGAAGRLVSSGKVDGREALLADFPNTARGPVLTDQVVRVYGDVAVVFYEQGDVPSQRGTRVWVRDNGQWKYLFAAVTAIATAMVIPPELRQAIDARTAAQDARDPNGLAVWTGDEYTVVNADGVLLDKAGRLRELRQQAVPATPPVRILEAAMVYGTAAVTRLRTATGYTVAVWALKPEGWRNVAGQVVNAPSTPPPAPAPTSPGKELPWTVPSGLSSDAQSAFDAHVRIQESGAAGDTGEYSRYTANEFIRIGPLGPSDRATLISRLKGRSGFPHDNLAVAVWDRVAVIRWRETAPAPRWFMRVMTRNPWGWQQAVTVSTDVPAK